MAAMIPTKSRCNKKIPAVKFAKHGMKEI